MSTPTRKSEKVLVTGATGFIGSHLCRRLIREGCEVHAVLRESSQIWRINDIKKDLQVHVADILDAERLEVIFRQVRPAHIVHLATSIVYSGITPRNEELLDVNVRGTMNVLNASRHLDYSCLINTGSSSEYGHKTDPMKEKDLCEPITFHGVTKLAATLCGQMVARRDKKPIIGLRIFSPYGPDDDERRFIAKMIRKCMRGEELELSEPSIAHDYIYVDDVVDLYVEVLRRGAKREGEIFNVGSGTQATLGEVADLVRRETNSRSRMRWHAFPRASYDTDSWVADMTKTFSHFAWRPRVTLNEGLSKTIQQMRSPTLD